MKTILLYFNASQLNPKIELWDCVHCTTDVAVTCAQSPGGNSPFLYTLHYLPLSAAHSDSFSISFNRLNVAKAVLQTLSLLIHYLIESVILSSKFSKHHNFQTVRDRDLKFITINIIKAP